VSEVLPLHSLLDKRRCTPAVQVFLIHARHRRRRTGIKWLDKSTAVRVKGESEMEGEKHPWVPIASVQLCININSNGRFKWVAYSSVLLQRGLRI